MAKTIKEIADNCGVPEQTVRGWCRRNHVAKDQKLDIVSVIREAVFAILSEWGQLKFQVAERRKSGIMNK